MRNNSSLTWPFICSILLGLCTLVVFGKCLPSQQTLLLQLKNSPPFNNYPMKLVNWNESSSCCSWEGVTCEKGYVTHLDLRNYGIEGRLDDSSVLFNLTHIKSLDLALNSFNSTIPSRIGNLTKLSHLNLWEAGFWVQIPIGISRLTSLVTLVLSALHEPKLEISNLRTMVQNLSKLQEIELDGVNILAPGNGWFQALSSSLPNLDTLSLSYCQVPDPLDQSLVGHQSLSVNNLEGTNSSSLIPKSFLKFSHLTQLMLRNCGLKGTFPNEIFQVPTLQIIDMSYNEFLEGTLPEFQINQSLQELVISSTKFSGMLPASLGNLRNLTSLYLHMRQFNGTLPSSMSNLTQLIAVDLSSNKLTGLIPSFDFSTKLILLDLSNNSFGGELPEFKTSSSSLTTLDLSHNNLEGLIPTSIFKLKNLQCLYLSYNKINGAKHQQIFDGDNSLLFLSLSHNNMRFFPNLKNLSVQYVSLSNNQISGVIPNWIWEVGSGTLVELDLSCNYLVGMQQPFVLPEYLTTLDLRNNQLQGNIPVLPRHLLYLDLSNNNFTSLPYDSFHNGSVISFFCLSNNSLAGVLLERICDIKHLLALDLSYNNLSGRIPTCLIETSDSRDMLNLRKNNLKSPIPDVFPRGCTIEALDLSGNFIEGEIPKSLANCFKLKDLDLGHNELIGEFPFLLMNLSTLQVLILRSNMLWGSIERPDANKSWPVLQILDIADKKFSGELPRQWLTILQAMIADKDNTQLEVLSLEDEFALSLDDGESYTRIYYEYTVTVTFKGLERELKKMLDIFTSIDLSRNNFHGQMPSELGELHALHILNLSHNALAGQIPSSIGNLRNLESLDLSWNNLSGTIPTQLQSLNFLQVLNLSFNQLVGMIPTGSQIQTFSEDAFIGNKGLYGCPLKRNCSDKEASGTLFPNATKDTRSSSGRKINWSLLSVEFGLWTGFGLVVMPLVFSRKWRLRYFECVDDISFKVFPLAVSRKWFQWTAI